MDDTLERRANQLKEMKRAHEEETAELREQLSQAKSRDRATAEALHDESSRVLDLQQRLKLSREQNLALEVRWKLCCVAELKLLAKLLRTNM